MYDEKLKKYEGDLTPRAKNGSKIRYVTECGEETKTQQHFKDQCDINRIVGNPNAVLNTSQQERFGDFSDMLDLAGSMQKAIDARNLFDSLPVELRKRCGQSVEGLFEFIADEKNKDELYKYGILQKPAAPPPIPTVRIEGFNPEAKKDGSLKKTKVTADE